MVNDAPLINAYTCRDSGEEKNQVLYKYMAGEKKKKGFISFGITDLVPPPPANEFRWLHYQNIAQLNDGGRWPSFP